MILIRSQIASYTSFAVQFKHQYVQVLEEKISRGDKDHRV